MKETLNWALLFVLFLNFISINSQEELVFKANKINSFHFEKTNETLSGYDSLKLYKD